MNKKYRWFMLVDGELVTPPVRCDEYSKIHMFLDQLYITECEAYSAFSEYKVPYITTEFVLLPVYIG